jgi:ribulose bisphosphate carboxylase small subunit
MTFFKRSSPDTKRVFTKVWEGPVHVKDAVQDATRQIRVLLDQFDVLTFEYREIDRLGAETWKEVSKTELDTRWPHVALLGGSVISSWVEATIVAILKEQT